MRFPLRVRVSLFVAIASLSLSLVTTFLFAWFFRTAAEKEIIARGSALGHALARAAAEGLAAEDLDLLDKAGEIVRAEDVVFAQIYSGIWSTVEAFPERRHIPPAPRAVEHFAGAATLFLAKDPARYDFYLPIVLRLPRSPEVTIGYARLALSAAPLRRLLRSVVIGGLLIALAITLLFVAITHVLIGTTVVDPLLDLHRAVGRFRDGQPFETQSPKSDDEIADLSREFNAMSLALLDREERLSEEKERLAVTLRSIGDGVIVTDMDGRVSLLNRVAEELCGWKTEEAAGKPFCRVFAILNEETREPCENIVARVMATGSVVSLARHTALVRRDGTQIVIEDAAAPIRDRESHIIGVVLVFRDITEKQRMEVELLKAEKLQAIGVLAGGIAHDFNNLLTGVLGHISLAKIGLTPGDRVQGRLDEAEAAARRAAELTAQLLTFSRGGAPVKRATAIADILREAARFVLSGTNVAAEFVVAEGILPVEIDAGQMSQVFNNLTMNALYAMPGGGRITFTVENVHLAAQEVATLAAGDYVCISVRDEGPGIAPEHLDRIFDPYFTTKPDGVGLGLTSSYSIVKKHDGLLTVASPPGEGATFRVYLPAARGAVVPTPSAEEPLHAGRGTVLVMDDEEVVRDVAGEILRTLGYEAITAVNGDEALALYRRARERGEPIRAVIMDLTIPGGMGGKEAVGRLLDLDPAARVIVSSGYSNDPVMAEYRAFGFKGVIVKPYTVRMLDRTLQEVLAG